MKNVVAKNSLSAGVANQNTATECYETEKLSTSTLDEIVDECFRYDGFSYT